MPNQNASKLSVRANEYGMALLAFPYFIPVTENQINDNQLHPKQTNYILIDLDLARPYFQ